VKKIIHQVSLSDIGGVQKSFFSYFSYLLKKGDYNHSIYSMHELRESFVNLKKHHFNLKKSFINKCKFIYFLLSKNYIIHFYNNLGSSSINKLLNLIPSSNIIFHERGAAWNAKKINYSYYKNNASKASLILANSNASKTMLSARFGINPAKIKVVYNGVLNKDEISRAQRLSRYSEKLSVGYIGRFESFKGVHSFINAAKLLPEYNFFIAGKGIQEEELKKLGKNFNNINFVGSVKQPLEFISKIDIMVVPSIREPFGNVIVEAGYCKKAVVASNVDGIPEIIQDGYSGILIDPDKELSFNEISNYKSLMPQFTINPKTQLLQKPQELDPVKICKAIKSLASDKNIRDFYGKNLNKEVKEKFTVENYYNQMENIYQNLK
jgi:glycosyltransferase involved in cell wall biosynthesis